MGLIVLFVMVHIIGAIIAIIIHCKNGTMEAASTGKVKEKCPKKRFRGGCCHRMALFFKTTDQTVHVLQISYLDLLLYHSGAGTEGYQ